MKIEVGESLIYSWLRHVKKCQIAQTNWKTSPLWKAAPDHKEDMRAVVAEIQQHFITLNLNVFKNDQDLEQALRQVEGDVIGISWSSGEPTLYAAESAFHEFGLNYGSKEVTCAKVISKLARTAIALQIFLPGLNSELFFASPKIHNNIMEILPKAIDELNAIFERHSMNCKARLIANGGFQREILEPVKALQENVSDTSEIFLRSLQMVNLFSRGRRYTDIIDFVDENEVSGNEEDEDSGIDDEEFGEIEDNIFAPRDERRAIRPVMRYSGREFNKVTASSTVNNYPELCWMNIRVARLNDERLNGRQFYFYCNVHNIEYLYSADVEALRNFCLSCNIIENQPRRYSFYIDYDRGILRANPGGGNVTLQLQRLPVDYCELHRE